MRILKRNKKKKIIKIIVVIILLTAIFFKPAYSFFIQTLNISGEATIDSSIIVTNDSTCNTSVNTATYYWVNGPTKYYTYNFSLTNLSLTTYYGWDIFLPVPSDAVVTPTNVNYTISNNILYLANTTYNGYLISGQMTDFSIIVATNQTYALRNINVYNCEQEGTINNDVNLKVDFVKTGAWGNIEQYDVVVTNDSTTTITAWEIIMNFNSDLVVQSSWNVNYTRNIDTLTFTNISYNGSILPSANITFGMQVASDSNTFNMNVISATGSR